jgi:hypothetical protein
MEDAVGQKREKLLTMPIGEWAAGFQPDNPLVKPFT